MMKEENIHKIIDLYFEAQLSRTEEDELLDYLLSFKGEDGKAKEALAVMLMARNSSILTADLGHSARKPSLENRFLKFRNLKRIVAVVLFVIYCATVLLYHFHHNQGDETEGVMLAYVEGVKVSDHSEIMKIVDDQLNDISMSTEIFSQTIATDLDDISNAFNEEGI